MTLREALRERRMELRETRLVARAIERITGRRRRVAA